jgi:hypothetical protein
VLQREEEVTKGWFVRDDDKERGGREGLSSPRTTVRSGQRSIGLWLKVD